MSNQIRSLRRFEQSLGTLESAIERGEDELRLEQAVAAQQRAFEEFRSRVSGGVVEAACREPLERLKRRCGEVLRRAEEELGAIGSERERLAAFGRVARARAAARRPERSRFIAVEA